jgi:hypothetical protein
MKIGDFSLKLVLIILCLICIDSLRRGRRTVQDIEDIEANALAAIKKANETDQADDSSNSTISNSTSASNSTSSNATSTNSTVTKPTGPAGTNVFSGSHNASNAVGTVGLANLSITELPNTVKRCDQVILVEVNRIKDFNDYCKVEKAFFTMSVYIINLFESKNSDKLIESITLDKLANVPKYLEGAPNCLDFYGKTGKRMGICFESQTKAESIIEAYKAFMKCRMGDNLKELTLEQMRAIFEMACGGKRIAPAQQKIFKKVWKVEKQGPKKVSDLKSMHTSNNNENYQPVNPFYGDLKTPGSRR